MIGHLLLLRRRDVRLVRLRCNLLGNGLRVEDPVLCCGRVDGLWILVHVGIILVNAELGVRCGAKEHGRVRLNDCVQEFHELVQV